jgi:hypothetical protein
MLECDPATQKLAAVDLAEEVGMPVVFETARMHNGISPDFPLKRNLRNHQFRARVTLGFIG